MLDRIRRWLGGSPALPRPPSALNFGRINISAEVVYWSGTIALPENQRTDLAVE
ncbi:MAG: hypothetical protein HYV07_19315 [Deltaproteobacteria bacterium]|nr:hypothetical protein [Deltaproteobacteria bacterium]